MNKGSYRGFETWYHAVRMGIKMYSLLFLWLLAAQAGLTALGIRIFLGDIDSGVLWSWLLAKGVSCVGPRHEMTFAYAGTVYKLPAAALAKHLQPYVALYLVDVVLIFLAAGSVYLLIPLFTAAFRARARRQEGRTFARGAHLVSPAELRRQIRGRGEETDLPFGELKLPRSAEVKHVFYVGRPGVGKTVLASQVIERLQARGGRGVVYDFKGDYTAKFYDPRRDVLFNPLDDRCVGWNLFNDVVTYMDVDAIAHSLIPPAYYADPFWNDAARDVLSGILHHLFRTN